MHEKSLTPGVVLHPRSFAAYEAAVSLSIPELTQMLLQIVDPGLLARMAGVTEPRSVYDWREGIRAPRLPQEQRLRAAAYVCGMIHDPKRPKLAQNWLSVPCPDLDYHIPLNIFCDLHETADMNADIQAVMKAAENFMLRFYPEVANASTPADETS